MTFRLGLTGSIGMGKSTTAAMFANEGVPVWDADAVVRQLYAKGGQATGVIAALLPEVIQDAAVSRPKLRALVAKDPSVLDRVQAIVHPLVAQSRADFLRGCVADIALLDIPLLFETGAEAACDAVVVVSAPADIQRARVLARGEMTQAEYELILARQLPDAEKRARADYVVETSTLDNARAAVQAICVDIRKRLAHA